MTGAELSRVGKSVFALRPSLFFTFNSRKATGTGTKGFPDHVILTPDYLAFVEVKGDGDKMSAHQEVFASFATMLAAKTSRIVYRLVSSPEDWDDLVNYQMVE